MQRSLLAALLLFVPCLASAMPSEDEDGPADAYVSENTGAARLRIPIEVPAGPGGFQPDLALSYSSHADDSPFGFGWSVNIGEIARTTRFGVPTFAPGDQYELDGELLVYNGTEDRYHTLSESFARIELIGETWTVTFPNGRIARYGANENSRIRKNADLDPGPGDGPVFRWLLSELEDESGNTITYTYRRDLDVGTAYPLEVAYGAGAEPWRVEFVLEPQARPDLIQSYRGGVNATLSYRVEEVRVRQSTTIFRRRTLSYDQGSYETGRSRLASTSLYGSDCGLSMAPSIDCGGMPPQIFEYVDGSDSTGAQWVRSSFQLPVGLNTQFANSAWQGTDMGVRFGDVNGDGLPDLLRALQYDEFNATPLVQVFLNTGNGWTATPDAAWTAALNAISFTEITASIIVDAIANTCLASYETDYNRGVRFAAYGEDSYANSLVFELRSRTRWHVSDINGDGLADLFASSQIGPYRCMNGETLEEPIARKEVWLNTGSAWERDDELSESFPAPIRIYSFERVTGSFGCWAQRTWQAPGSCNSSSTAGHFRYHFSTGTKLVDVNGDQHLDVVSWAEQPLGTYANYLPAPPVGVWLNSAIADDPTERHFVPAGPGYSIPWPIMSIAGGQPAPTGMRFVDLNRDGLVDIVKTGLSDLSGLGIANPPAFSSAGIWLNTGDGWCDSNTCAEALRYSLPEPLIRRYWVGNSLLQIAARSNMMIAQTSTFFADLNGDGMVDIVRADNTTSPPSLEAYLHDPAHSPTVWKPAPSNYLPTAQQSPTFETWVIGGSYSVDPTLPVYYRSNSGARFRDVDGDGSIDIVKNYYGSGSDNWVDLSVRAHADRLRRHENGRGGIVEFEYQGSAEQLDPIGSGLSEKAEDHAIAMGETDTGTRRVTSSPVVSKKTVQSTDSTYEWHYRYAHSTWCPLHRSRFGFRVVSTQLPEPSPGMLAERHSYYYQRHGRGGKTALRETFENGVLQHRHEMTWDAFLAENAPGGGVLLGSAAGVHVGRLVSETESTLYGAATGAVSSRLLEYDDTYGFNFVSRDERTRPTGVLRLERTPKAADIARWILGLPATEKAYNSAVGGTLVSDSAFTYNTDGRLTERQEAVGPRGGSAEITTSERWAYDPDGNLDWHEDQKGQREYYCHDGESDIQPGDGLCAAATSGNRGTLQAVLDRKGDVTEFEPDPRGQPKVVRYMWSGDEDRVGLDAFDRPIRAEHRPGAGGIKLLWEQTYHDGTVGTPVERHDYATGTDYLTSWQYFDGLGRASLSVREGPNPQGGSATWIGQYTLRDHAGRVVRQTYDQACGTDSACAALTGAEDPAEAITYDTLGRMLQRDVPGTPGGSYTYSYSSASHTLGNLDRVLIQDPRSNHTQRLEDRDRVVLVQECAAGSSGSCSSPDDTQYTYEATGEIATIVDPGANTITFTYDTRGAVRSIDHPDRGLSTFEYDANGNLDETINARNQTTENTYDPLDRVIQIDRDASLYATITYDDADTRLRKDVTLASGPITAYKYDDLGQEKRVDQTALGETLIFYSYLDQLGRPNDLHYPDGTVIAYEYEGAYLKRICRINQGSAPCPAAPSTELYLEDVTYDDIGRPTLEAHLPGDLSYTYRSADHRLARANFLAGSAQTSEFDLTYDYDAMGGVLSIDDAIESVLTTYAYDHRNRLKTWTRGVTSKSYAYDSLGNLTEKAGTGSANQTYGDPRPHAITHSAVSGHTYEYDADGNVSRRGPHFYLYNADNRLTRVGTTAGASDVATFVYDVDGDRMGQLDADGVTTKRILLREHFEWEPGATAETSVARINIYAFGRLIVQRTGTGATLTSEAPPLFGGKLPAPPPWILLLLLAAALATTLFLLGAHAPLIAQPAQTATRWALTLAIIMIPAAGQSGDPTNGSYKHRWYLSDHLGTGLVVVQGNGFVVSRRVFAPFGGVASESPDPATEVTETVFGGQRFEETVGLYDFQARWYDAEAGRFLSTDPLITDLLDPQTLNPYGYVRNDPLNRIDPTGEMSIPSLGDIATAFGDAIDQFKDFAAPLTDFFPLEQILSTAGVPVEDAFATAARSVADRTSAFSQFRLLRDDETLIPAVGGGLAIAKNETADENRDVATIMNGALTGTLLAGAGGTITYVAYTTPTLVNLGVGLPPLIGPAADKLASTAAKFGTTSARLLQRALHEGERFRDLGNKGNINVFLRRPDGSPGFVRVTLTPTGQRVISSGLNQARDVANQVARGRLVPLD